MDEGPSDAYAERAMAVRELATALDTIRDSQARGIVRDMMRRLVLTMEVPKSDTKVAFVKPAKDT